MINMNGLGSSFNYVKNVSGRKNVETQKTSFSYRNSTQYEDKTYHLKMGGLVSKSSNDGGCVTVYKADDYSENNPALRVVTMDANGEETEVFIDPRKVNPSNASANEILALNAYLVDAGISDNSIHTTMVLGESGSKNSSFNRYEFLKQNYVSLVRDMMNMQYRAHNIAGYNTYNKILGIYESWM